MKIINYQGVSPLTADNAIITSDTTLFTADATVIFGITNIKIIPREMVTSIYVQLYNELTFNTISVNTIGSNSNGYLVFSVPIEGIKEGDSFELTVRKDSFTGDIIYRDKAYATIVQDLENYKLSYPNSNGVIIL